MICEECVIDRCRFINDIECHVNDFTIHSRVITRAVGKLRSEQRPISFRQSLTYELSLFYFIGIKREKRMKILVVEQKERRTSENLYHAYSA